MSKIIYQDGYKYQLRKGYVHQGIFLPVPLQWNISNGFIELTSRGRLTLREGYAWDGPSGPAFDTRTAMRGSLVHDALYQLMREGMIDHKTSRSTADELLREICLEDGMSTLRAWLVFKAVSIFGDPFANPKTKRDELVAP